jgi:probable HAF family extracellular repeat protein
MLRRTNLKLELARKKRWKLPLLFVLGFVCPSFGAQIIDLGTLGGEWSAAYGMNDSDQVVGLLQTTTGDMHAFLYSHGQMTDLYPLQGLVDEPMGINNSGRIAASVAATDGIIYPAVQT